jgi:hypothetical protein
MEARRVGGIQMSFMGRMGWSYGKILGEDGGSFLVIQDLR